MGILTLYGTKKTRKNSHMFSINSFTFMEYFLPQTGKNTDHQCSTTGKPTRSFATERVSLDSV
jgi:hypothetical protein